jgi:uncharacterized spore protein YtfJ
MEDSEKLVATATAEIERILSGKTVVGQPIELDGTTVIPLLSVGFGFAAGTGTGNDAKRGQGGGAGFGGGGGIKPVALLIADKNGVRVEALKGGAASVLEKVAESVGRALNKGNVEKAPN